MMGQWKNSTHGKTMKILHCNNPSCNETAHIYPNGDMSVSQIIKFGVVEGKQRYKCNTCLHIWREGASPQHFVKPLHWRLYETWLDEGCNANQTARKLLRHPDFGSAYNHAKVKKVLKYIKTLDYSGYQKLNGNPVISVSILRVGQEGEVYRHLKSVDIANSVIYHTVKISTIQGENYTATSVNFSEAEELARENLIDNREDTGLDLSMDTHTPV